MKTNELTGRALDYAVALAEGLEPFIYRESPARVWLSTPHKSGAYGVVPNYQTDRDGDNIIDREKISTEWNERCEVWSATVWTSRTNFCASGATRREAAMRAFCVSRLGENIEIPEELHGPHTA